MKNSQHILIQCLYFIFWLLFAFNSSYFNAWANCDQIDSLYVNYEKNCLSAAETGIYEVNVCIIGGVPPYTIQGIVSHIIEERYFSLSIADGIGFFFIVTDNIGQSVTIDGSNTSPCFHTPPSLKATIDCLEDQTGGVLRLLIQGDYSNIEIVGNQSGDTLLNGEFYESIWYTFYDDGTVIDSMTVFGTVDCVTPFTPQTDSLIVLAGRTTSINVLANDGLPNLTLQEVYANKALVYWQEDGLLVYQDDAHLPDTTTISYIAKDAGGREEWGTVLVQVQESFDVDYTLTEPNDNGELILTVIPPTESLSYEVRLLGALDHERIAPYQFKIWTSATVNEVIIEVIEEASCQLAGKVVSIPTFPHENCLPTKALQVTYQVECLREQQQEHITVTVDGGVPPYQLWGTRIGNVLSLPQPSRYIFQSGSGQEPTIYVEDAAGAHVRVDIYSSTFCYAGQFTSLIAIPYIHCLEDGSGGILQLNPEALWQEIIVEGHQTGDTLWNGEMHWSMVSIPWDTVVVTGLVDCMHPLESQADTITLYEGGFAIHNVLTNDIGLDLRLVAVSTASTASFYWNDRGQITYTSPSNFEGEEQLFYTVEDKNGQTTEESVYIKILPRFDFDYQLDCLTSNEKVKLTIIPPTDTLRYQVSLDGGLTYEAVGKYSFHLNRNQSQQIIVLRDAIGCLSKQQEINLSAFLSFFIDEEASTLASTCGGEVVIQGGATNNEADTYQWATDPQFQHVLATTTEPVFTFSSQLIGEQTIYGRGVYSDSHCTTESVAVTTMYYPALQIENIQENRLTTSKKYIVQFTITTEPLPNGYAFIINEDTLTTNQFTSSPIPITDDYHFTVGIWDNTQDKVVCTKNVQGSLFSEPIKLDLTLAFKQNQTTPLLLVYPNPNHGYSQVRFSEAVTKNGQLTIFNTLGQIIQQKTIAADTPAIDLTIENKGIYFLEWDDGEERIVEKVIVF